MSTLRDVILTKRMIFALLLGLCSGLPFAAVESTLQAWLTDSHLTTKQIGEFALVLLPFSLKFLWAPLLDAWSPPFLGRRRGWVLLSQLGLAASFWGMSRLDPGQQTDLVFYLALVASFFSATQDIALDGHRREILRDEELGLGSSLFVNGYKIGYWISAAYVLWLSGNGFGWPTLYIGLGVSMLACGVITYFADEPVVDRPVVRTFADMVIQPFRDFFTRPYWITIIMFIFLYKIGDQMAGTLRTTFLMQHGYTKDDIAEIAKTFGLVATIAGGLFGGALILHMGQRRALWSFGILQAISTLGFYVLARSEVDLLLLALVIGFEYGTSGMGTAAFVGFMGTMCNRQFSASQYALLTSLMKIPSNLIGSRTGGMVEAMGWANFFLMCTAAAIPAFILLAYSKLFVESRE